MKAIKTIVALLMMFDAATQAALPRIPIEPDKAELWKARRTVEISELLTKPKDEAISGLGKMIRQLGVLNYRDCEQKSAVILELRSGMCAIPGHAEYFGNKIRGDRGLWKEGRGHEVKGSPVWDFETLAQLPSPETVSVLGSFLDDEEGRIPAEVFKDNPDAHVAPVAANNLLAAKAFAGLGIANPPLHEKPGTMGYDDIQPWRLWFAQVQAGTRTFRFEGDPREYSLAGPVSEAQSPTMGGSDSSSAKAPAAGANQSTAKDAPLPVVLLITAGVLVALALWYSATRKRKSAQAGSTSG